jgi:hypothetical protein
MQCDSMCQPGTAVGCRPKSRCHRAELLCCSRVQLEESEEEVRELQAQMVQFSERVVKLQTLLQVQVRLETDRNLSMAHRPNAAQQPVGWVRMQWRSNLPEAGIVGSMRAATASEQHQI